jgi:hypothetical protein
VFSVVEIPNLPTDPQQLAVRIAFPPEDQAAAPTDTPRSTPD